MEIWLLLALVSVLNLYPDECSSMQWAPMRRESTQITEGIVFRFYNYITGDQSMRCLNLPKVNLHDEVLTHNDEDPYQLRQPFSLSFKFY